MESFISTDSRTRNGRMAPRHKNFLKECYKQLTLCISITVVLLCDASACLAMNGMGHSSFLFLYGVRISLLCISFLFAVKFGTGQWTIGRNAARATSSGNTGNDPELGRGTSLTQLAPLQQPLTSSASVSSGRDVRAENDELARLQQQSQAAQDRNALYQNVVLGICFFGVAIQCTYTGAQVVAMPGLRAFEGFCITSVVVCVYSEFLLLKSLVDRLTEEDGVLLPAIHEHPLYYRNKVGFAECAQCGERIGLRTGGYEAFQCKRCTSSKGGGKGGGKGGSFWVCLPCYRKQTTGRSTQEGILRGDKGPKPSQTLTSWQYLLRALKLTKAFRGTLVCAVGFTVITQAGRVLLPNYQGSVINALIDGDRADFAAMLRMFLIISLSSSLFGSLQGFAIEVVSRRLSMHTKIAMFQSLIRQDIAFFDGSMIGQLTSRMSNDVMQALQPVRQLFSTVLANVLLLAGGLFMCFLTSWKLTVLAFTLISPVIYLSSIYAAWSRKLNSEVQASVADANAVATEALGNIRTIRSFGAEEVEETEFRGHLQTALNKGLKDAFASSGVMAVDQYLNYAATTLILWYGGMSVLRSEGQADLSIGQLITFNLYWNMLTQSIKNLTNMLTSLVRAASSAQRVFEIIDLVPDIALEGGVGVAGAAGQAQPFALEFRNVGFTYQMRPGQKVLSQLSFSVPPGKTVALVGRSGAGKTTLVNLLLRFYDPQEGELLLNGRPLPDYDLKSYKRRVGVVSQETQVFCRSVSENLKYGMQLDEVTDQMVVQAAEMANAHSFIQELDGGYAGMVGERGVRLSGGQRQRLAIARALLRRPTLLLLDEATSALDAENEGKVQQALDTMMSSMAGACSVLLIAHRLSTVMNADSIVVIDKGCVVEQGTHTELLENNNIYAQLVRRQLSRQANVLEEGGPEPDSSRHSSTVEEHKGKGKRGKGKGKREATGSSEPAAEAADSIDRLFDEAVRHVNSADAENAESSLDRSPQNESGAAGEEAHERWKGGKKGSKDWKGKQTKTGEGGAWHSEEAGVSDWWKGGNKGSGGARAADWGDKGKEGNGGVWEPGWGGKKGKGGDWGDKGKEGKKGKSSWGADASTDGETEYQPKGGKRSYGWEKGKYNDGFSGGDQW